MVNFSRISQRRLRIFSFLLSLIDRFLATLNKPLIISIAETPLFHNSWIEEIVKKRFLFLQDLKNNGKLAVSKLKMKFFSSKIKFFSLIISGEIIDFRIALKSPSEK